MNKYFIKGIAVSAIAFSAISCNHDLWNQRNDTTNQDVAEFQANFKNTVMGNHDIDAQQTWNTAVTTTITLTSAKSGTLKIYPKDPAQGSTIAALYTSTINSGETKTFVIAKPQDATVLYATILDADQYKRVMIVCKTDA